MLSVGEDAFPVLTDIEIERLRTLVEYAEQHPFPFASPAMQPQFCRKIRGMLVVLTHTEVEYKGVYRFSAILKRGPGLADAKDCYTIGCSLGFTGMMLKDNGHPTDWIAGVCTNPKCPHCGIMMRQRMPAKH